MAGKDAARTSVLPEAEMLDSAEGRERTSRREIATSAFLGFTDEGQNQTFDFIAINWRALPRAQEVIDASCK
jgi:hypothetical protein